MLSCSVFNGNGVRSFRQTILEAGFDEVTLLFLVTVSTVLYLLGPIVFEIEILLIGILGLPVFVVVTLFRDLVTGAVVEGTV